MASKVSRLCYISEIFPLVRYALATPDNIEASCMPTTRMNESPEAATFVEEVEISGHIIDSLILPKVLDCITAGGGSFRIKNISIGQDRADPSFAAIDVSASTDETLQQILAQIADHGAVATASHDCQLVEADLDGAFPEGFYSTTNQRTEIRRDGHWHPVADQEMDCGITLDSKTSLARCIPMSDVQRGMPILVGHLGTRVFPHERTQQDHAFGFMNSAVSTEKPKGVVIRQIAKQLFDNRRGKGKTLLVGGPAIVHTGSGNLVSELLRDGYIGKLFAKFMVLVW